MNFHAFYCCYGTDDEVEGSNPVPVAARDVTALAKRILAAPDDFFGIVDANDTTLQVMFESDDTYWTEIPLPERRGSYGAKLSYTELYALLDALPATFEPSIIPGATFAAW